MFLITHFLIDHELLMKMNGLYWKGNSIQMKSKYFVNMINVEQEIENTEQKKNKARNGLIAYCIMIKLKIPAMGQAHFHSLHLISQIGGRSTRRPFYATCMGKMHEMG